MPLNTVLPRLGVRLAHGSAMLGLLLGVAGLVYVAVPPPTVAHAQTRDFPAGTRAGMLTMGNYPLARIDDRDVRFAPGARIHDQGNLVIVPSSVGGPVAVRYTMDGTGLVTRAWILTADEIAQVRRERSGR